MQRFANPARFIRAARAVLPWALMLMALSLGFGLYDALVLSPADYQQGESVRIMYLHVPSAYLALGAYALMTISSIVVLIWRHPLADVAARAAAPIGAVFTAFALITGAIWGQPTWGTWWVWDARLTSVLVLFFIYLGYMGLRAAMQDPEKAADAAAVLTIVGAIDLPIIKYSVDWWNTLHQPASLFRESGVAIDGSMLRPLLVMVIAFTAFFTVVHLWRMVAMINQRKIRALAMRQAREG